MLKHTVMAWRITPRKSPITPIVQMLDSFVGIATDTAFANSTSEYIAEDWMSISSMFLKRVLECFWMTRVEVEYMRYEMRIVVHNVSPNVRKKPTLSALFGFNPGVSI